MTRNSILICEPASVMLLAKAGEEGFCFSEERRGRLVSYSEKCQYCIVFALHFHLQSIILVATKA